MQNEILDENNFRYLHPEAACNKSKEYKPKSSLSNADTKFLIHYKILSPLGETPVAIKAIEFPSYAQGETEDEALEKLYDMLDLRDEKQLKNGFIIIPVHNLCE